jgi:hypothetical protein
VRAGPGEVQANYYVVTEWKKQTPDSTRSIINSRRRHFHNTKRSLVSHFSMSDHPERTYDILIDDSKEAQVRDLGRAVQEIEFNGSYFGQFSLSVVIHDRTSPELKRPALSFTRSSAFTTPRSSRNAITP